MWTKSEQLLERAKQSLAGGVSSPFRAMFRPVPLYFRCGKGSRLEDVDGNSYIDYTLAWGPLILGHAPEPLVEAISAQLHRGMTFGAQHELEFAVSERIQSMVPSAERVAFTSSGSEALQLAFRLSRAFTGRNMILKFEGHYHGWMDSELLSYHPSREQVGPEDAPNVVLHSKGQMAAVASRPCRGRVEQPRASRRRVRPLPGQDRRCRDGIGALQQRMHYAGARLSRVRPRDHEEGRRSADPR